MAIASLILGIIWLGGLGSILAVVFGALARRDAKQTGVGGRGLALAGMILGVIGILGAIGFYGSLAAINKAVTSSERPVTSTGTTNNGCATGSGYPDKQPKDCLAGTGQRVDLFGMTVVASHPRRITESFTGSKGICVDVSLLNHANKSQDYNEFDFKLQTPAGDVRSFDFVPGQENGLGSGQLVAGGTKSGTTCFEDKGEHGRFVLIWKPDAFDSSRGIWLIDLP